MITGLFGLGLRSLPALTVASLVVILSGCNTLSGVPSIVRAEVQPATVKPGDSIRIEVEVKDKHAIVSRMQGEVKEDPQRLFALRDDGEGQDTKAKDGIWTLSGVIPEKAPVGTFHLVFTAYSGKKIPVPVRRDGHATPLSAEAVVTVQAAQP